MLSYINIYIYIYTPTHCYATPYGLSPALQILSEEINELDCFDPRYTGYPRFVIPNRSRDLYGYLPV